MTTIEREHFAAIAKEIGHTHGVDWALVGPLIIDLVAAGYAAGQAAAAARRDAELSVAFDRGWRAARDQPDVSLIAHHKVAP